LGGRKRLYLVGWIKMKKLLISIIAVTCLISSCKIKKELKTQTSAVESDDNFFGHIKMGLIEYEIIDTLNTSQENADMMIEMMKPSLEIVMVFDSVRSVELVKENNKYIRRILYDRTSKTAIEFLEKDSVQYYSEMNVSQMMEEVNSNDDEMSKMFKLIPYSDSKIEVLEFKCDEIIMMQPPDFTEIYGKAYVTDKIPHISEAMGPMSKYLKGAPIKTIMFINGIKITMGALEFNKNNSMDKYLIVDKSSLQKLSNEEFELMKAY